MFLKLLTMDEAGLRQRKSKAIPLKIIWERLTPSERHDWFASTSTGQKPKLKKEKKPLREQLQALVFSRFSYDEKPESRRQPLDQSFLNQRLIGARSYDRIAGYFSSSILEVAGEALESISGMIRVVCNSDLDPKDVETARAANLAMRREWCASRTGETDSREFSPTVSSPLRVSSLGKMQVKVLPSEKFGLVHGKAGVVTMADGTQTSFLGSTNETLGGVEAELRVGVGRRFT